MFNQKAGIWRLSLEQIEATVSDHLGRGRVQGNQPGPCFSRQVSMYLAKNVGGWSTTRIGRFYNGRQHTTVLHAIAKIERLRKDDESVDALLEVLTAVLSPRMDGHFSERFEPGWSKGTDRGGCGSGDGPNHRVATDAVTLTIHHVEIKIRPP